MSRVFVTCIGRCGSVSFREACRYATNYQNGHESKCGLLEYPDQHIEVSPQIRNVVSHLARKYPNAKWVHLTRDPEPCMQSLARLGHGSVMRAYHALYPTTTPSDQPIDVAFRYYWAENDIITAQLKDVPPANQMQIRLETVRDQWKEFWDWIGAEGNFNASLTAWDVKRNTGEERGEI